MLPIIVITGKENVGKSSLFNRLVGIRASVTHSIPGTTRDCNIKDFEFWGTRATLVDTGGYLPYLARGLKSLVNKQVELYLQKADIILFLVDIVSGITSVDLELNAYIRKLGKPIILIINKIDNQRKAQNLEEFYKLGFKEVIMISAIHNIEIDTLLDAIKEKLGTTQQIISSTLPRINLGATFTPLSGEPVQKIAILGRPNVGKSTYINALLKEPRMIVYEEPGTTIDSIDVTLRYKDTDIILIDTPGLRKRAKITTDLEYYSSVRTDLTISRCNIGLLLVDATSILTHQDKTLISMLLEKGKGIVIVVNKIDIGIAFDNYTTRFAKFIPVSYISALKRKNIYEPIAKALLVTQARQMRISRKQLGQFVQNLAKIKINSIVQTEIAPPTFKINTNRPLTPVTIRFIENQLREQFDFTGTPIVFTFAKFLN